MFHPSCNMLEIAKIEEDHMYLEEYKEYKEGMVLVDDTPMHQFKEQEKIRYEEPKVAKLNLGDQKEPKPIIVGDDWDPI